MGIVTSASSVQNQDRCAERPTRQSRTRAPAKTSQKLEAWPLSTFCPTGSPLQVAPRNFKVQALQTFGPPAADPTRILRLGAEGSRPRKTPGG